MRPYRTIMAACARGSIVQYMCGSVGIYRKIVPVVGLGWLSPAHQLCLLAFASLLLHIIVDEVCLSMEMFANAKFFEM